MKASTLINLARHEVGVKEAPANSNRTKYGAWYGMNGQPWCMMFVQWVFYHCGEKLPIKTASCGEFMRFVKQKYPKQWVRHSFQPGDVVIFDFPGNSATTDHVGIVTKVMAGCVRTIEGNTGVGNDANGGAVMERTRDISLIVGGYRHKFEKEEEEVTQADFNKMMEVYLTERNKKDPSDVSAEARVWAENNGIITGDAAGNKNYKGFCTREHMVLFLYRFAKLIGKG